MNIFIVVSPLQLLNSIEAVEHFKVEDNVLLFLIADDESSHQMKELLVYYQWDKILYIDYPKSNIDKLIFPIKLHLLINKLLSSQIENIFFGEYRSIYIQHMVNYFNCSKCYLVDDGLATLNIDKNGNEKVKSNAILFLYKLFFYKLEKIDFTCFSIFNLKQKNVVRNNYSFIKKLNYQKEVKPVVYFIGQPIVELEMMSNYQYKLELEKIIKFYVPKKFVYILHRREEEQKIKSLALELNFHYKRFDNR